MHAPFPFQRAALKSASERFAAGAKSVLLVSPTGSGKTVMGTFAARSRFQAGGRVVWIAHRDELVSQAVASLTSAGLDVGHNGTNRAARVQVCMIQTLLARGEAPQADLVVVDEGHHYAEGNEWTRVVQSYREAGRRLLFLTATPQRADGKGLREVCDELVLAAQIRELIALGRLVPCKVAAPPHKLKAGEIWRTPANAYQELRAELHRDPRAVVFAPNTDACDEYAAQFKAAGIASAIVLGDTEPRQRKARLAAFAENRIRVLINVMVLTEGWDCPALDTVIMGRGCGSQSMLLQTVGRGMRASEGKSEMHFLDLRGVTYDHGPPDADREYTLDGIGIRCSSASGPRECPVCHTVYQDGPCPVCERETGGMLVPHEVGREPLKRYEHLTNAPAETAAIVLAGILRNRKGGQPRSTRQAAVIFRRMVGRNMTSEDMRAAHTLMAVGE